jgi:2-polyprenyl-3-methyl-5-hydroxy-6-metoxy-1,4-benzoquinol methylase
MIEPAPALESVACPLCGQSGASLELEARDWLHASGETFRYVRCRQCGLLYLNPRPAPGAIGRYYPRDSYYTFQDPGTRLADVIRPVHRRLAAQLTRQLGPGQAFDVGCGDGSFLLGLRELGWQSAGIEYDSEAVARLQQRWQLPVVAGDFLTAALPETRYDLVSMLEVLEHFHQPLAALKRAWTLLKPGGTLFVTVPNVASLEYRVWRADWVSLEPPLHLYHFDTTTLSLALRQAGFQIVSLQSSASTAGLTRSLWLKLRRRAAGASGSAAPYRARSWRRVAHAGLNALFWPVGTALALSRLGPGLRAQALRPA